MAAFLFLAWSRRRRMLSATVLVVVVGTTLLSLVIAGDISRSLAMLLPAALMGILLLAQQRPHVPRIALSVVLLANLLLPAQHVIWSFKAQIHHFFHEVNRWRNPPPHLNAEFYLRDGAALFRQGDRVQAMRFFNNAIKLNPRFAPAYVHRAWLRVEVGDLDLAETDLETALRHEPRCLDAFFVRSLVRTRRGDRVGAARDQSATLELETSVGSSRDQAECRKLLDQFRRPAGN